MNSFCSHEAAHAIVASALGHQAGAIVTATRGQTVFQAEVTDPTHRVAIGVAGQLGPLYCANPLATPEEAHNYLRQNRKFSATDWRYINAESVETYWAGFHLAVEILQRHHSALVWVAEKLASFGDVNFMEVQLACRSMTVR
jgi:hypothetical protein